ncbi:DNA mismatch repair protein MutS [Psychroflexus tropicus]|uniref:DNA mismatch repair protein MutS n=1 Tax=Psychroflexus tropicus TaxID=197345 RepID=UPI0003A8B02C|nr:DNA mismatch repair protein MutS [Psychroflexus tropicus]
MKQYNSIKEKYPDAMLLFRVGDFYETFGEDAVAASRILNIILTNRNNGGERSELAGFPHHSLNTYLPKLVKAGLRVAICDQLEDPKQTKKIVKRGVTELITPGVSFNDDVLSRDDNNFLCSIFIGSKSNYGISFLDVSTGEFLVSEGALIDIDKLIQNFSPSEILVSKKQKTLISEQLGNQHPYFYIDDWVFKADLSHNLINSHFQTTSLKGFGIQAFEEGIIASGAILHYLSETNHSKLQHINNLSRIPKEDYVWMDKFTIKNLELFQSTSPDGVCLADIIDKTSSAMGSRLLKRWLAFPLKSKQKVEQRLDTVSFLKSDQELHIQLRDYLKEINDLERLVSKISTQKINPRELVQLKHSLDIIDSCKNDLSNSQLESLVRIADHLNPCEALKLKIEAALSEEPPVNILKGKAIRTGYSEALDELRTIAYSGHDYLNEMIERESKATGISSLKIGSNNVYGFYFEVRHAHKDKVPEDWTRKQTLVNAERYITEELKVYEEKIFSAEDQIASLEQQLFQDLVIWTQDYMKVIQQNAFQIAQLDCLSGFAQLAIENNYSKPRVNDEFALSIKEGRHPVIETQLKAEEEYISNDLFLDQDTDQIIMITGPNMSGKSALLRQTALIVLLAQMGSFVPATSAEIGMVDKIFTRVGASDNISMGESTFMVEMNESASILNNLSRRSLVLLDEIGRGTSTYDGISIAWAIAEFLHEHPSKAKTLFATHYHELNEMCKQFERIKNYNVSVKELKDNVLFLRKLVPGGSEHSFGIHVAKMAGMPQYVIHKANSILKKLESMRDSDQDADGFKKAVEPEPQLSFFNMDDPLLEQIREEILKLDIDTLTPVEALMKLNEIKRLIAPKSKS